MLRSCYERASAGRRVRRRGDDHRGSRTIRQVPAVAVSRVRGDRCPGVLRLIEAVDGLLARVRLPGGLIEATGLRVLAQAAEDLGDGRLELTSRGNVQLRGLAADAGGELGQRLWSAGLWPSTTHERVRNIVASPLAGIDRGPDLSSLVGELDAALCADPRLADLSGRFLFTIDDGRGDVAGLRSDVTAVLGPNVCVNGIAVTDVIGSMIAWARAFLDERAYQRSSAWHIDELDGGAAPVAARVFGDPAPPVSPSVPVDVPARPAGLVPQPDGWSALVTVVPLGRLSAVQARWLADRISGRAARITPWRSIVLPDLADGATVARRAVEEGFAVDADSPWRLVSACAGRPGCSHALADVQADARAWLGDWPGRTVHWSGCERRCGRPADPDVDVVAGPTGYEITERR
ncbi:MAG: precorrin-3B synthase [Actinobacteria bacterium]|nr:precorrin-3B synthase [Actinomycetota bacterium]